MMAPIPTSEILEAARWAAELFKERTIAVATGISKNPYDFDPASRVTWSEIHTEFSWGSKYGMAALLNARIDFQPLWEKEIKKRGLFRVLRRKQTASEWYERLQAPKE